MWRESYYLNKSRVGLGNDSLDWYILRQFGFISKIFTFFYIIVKINFGFYFLDSQFIYKNHWKTIDEQLIAKNSSRLPKIIHE